MKEKLLPTQQVECGSCGEVKCKCVLPDLRPNGDPLVEGEKILAVAKENGLSLCQAADLVFSIKSPFGHEGG